MQDLSDQNQKLQAQLQAALEENKRLRKAQEGNHNHLSFVKSGPMLPLESQAQPRNLKTEVITTLESAVGGSNDSSVLPSQFGLGCLQGTSCSSPLPQELFPEEPKRSQDSFKLLDTSYPCASLDPFNYETQSYDLLEQTEFAFGASYLPEPISLSV